jgi:hydroxymethylpyrimidine/phosphomethylpyrimidine kinase
MQTVLTIAGFDPSSGAGVTADLMVFAAHGLFGTACITALTVQSTTGVKSTHSVDSGIVAETLDCLDDDLRPVGVKMGMLSSFANSSVVIDYLETLNEADAMASRVPIVLDPVIRSSSGRELLEPRGVMLLRERLLGLVDWVTPNLEELAVLAGRPVTGCDDIPGACRSLQVQTGEDRRGRRLGILATGGHLDPPNDFLLTPDGEGLWLVGERVSTRSTHGTGCAFSSAFLSRLVLGDTPELAAAEAKRYVAGALKASTPIGNGFGPMNHLWSLRQ